MVDLKELRLQERRGLLMFLAVGDLRLGVHGWAGDTIGMERHGDSEVIR